MTDEGMTPCGGVESGDEAFKVLVEGDERHDVYGYVAYAIMEELRVQQLRHIEGKEDETGSLRERDGWYRAQPLVMLERVQDTAEGVVDDFASGALEDTLEEHTTRISESVVVTEIARRTRKWPAFWISVAGGFVGTLLFAILLAAVGFIWTNDYSIQSLVDWMSNQGATPAKPSA
jgi:hypothetical protein